MPERTETGSLGRQFSANVDIVEICARPFFPHKFAGAIAQMLVPLAYPPQEVQREFLDVAWPRGDCERHSLFLVLIPRQGESSPEPDHHHASAYLHLGEPFWMAS